MLYTTCAHSNSLETARLSVAYSLEGVSPLGQRQGKLGARLTWNPENNRLRLASRLAVTYNPLLDAQATTFTVSVQLGPEPPSGGVRVAFTLFPE